MNNLTRPHEHLSEKVNATQNKSSPIIDRGFVCCPQNERDEGHNGFIPTFRMKNYTQKHHSVVKEITFHTYSGNLGHFLKTLVGRPTAVRLFKENKKICYGGYFSADRDVIRRQRVELYELLLSEQKFTLEEV